MFKYHSKCIFLTIYTKYNTKKILNIHMVQFELILRQRFIESDDKIDDKIKQGLVSIQIANLKN